MKKHLRKERIKIETTTKPLTSEQQQLVTGGTDLVASGGYIWKSALPDLVSGGYIVKS